MLEDFIKLGRQIINFDYESAYGSDYRRVSTYPAVALPQPGFVGHSYKGVVILGLNPGEGAFRSWPELNREFGDLIQGWGRRADVATYNRVFSFFLGNFANSPTWDGWTRLVLEAASISVEDIALLNLVKVATKGDAKPTSKMFAVDWEWTRKQLDVLQPKVVVAGGVAVLEQFNRRWIGIPPFQVHEQNRRRSIPGPSRRQQAQLIAEAIRAIA